MNPTIFRRSLQTITEGASIKCGDNSDQSDDSTRVYRYTNGNIRWYGSSAIAASWDKNWENFETIDCTGFLPIDAIGNQMPPNTLLSSSDNEGQEKCVNLVDCSGCGTEFCTSFF